MRARPGIPTGAPPADPDQRDRELLRSARTAPSPACSDRFRERAPVSCVPSLRASRQLGPSWSRAMSYGCTIGTSVASGWGMKHLVVLGVALVLASLTAAVAGAEGVRAPRDSPVMLHHLLRPSGSIDSSRLSSPSIGLPKLACPEPYVQEPKPGPGFGPVWVPASRCWNGSKTVVIPGHWVP